MEGPSGNQSGLVQVSFGGHGLGFRPAEGFEASLASVACRQLGLYGHNLSVDTAAVLTSGRVGVACSGDEASLVDCPFLRWSLTSITNAIVCRVGKW